MQLQQPTHQLIEEGTLAGNLSSVAQQLKETEQLRRREFTDAVGRHLLELAKPAQTQIDQELVAFEKVITLESQRIINGEQHPHFVTPKEIEFKFFNLSERPSFPGLFGDVSFKEIYLPALQKLTQDEALIEAVTESMYFKESAVTRCAISIDGVNIHEYARQGVQKIANKLGFESILCWNQQFFIARHKP